MDIKHRLYVIISLAAVDEAIELRMISKGRFQSTYCCKKKIPSNKIIFANGGDRLILQKFWNMILPKNLILISNLY